MKPVPHSVTVNTGDQHTLTEIIDGFFLETKTEVENSYVIPEEPIPFEIRSAELHYTTNTESNDRITYLIFKEEVLALVLETRTESNYVHYTFSRNLDCLEQKFQKKKI